MSQDTSSKAFLSQQVAAIVNQVTQKLQENDYAAAQIMVNIALDLLDSLQLDIEYHLCVEQMVRDALNDTEQAR